MFAQFTLRDVTAFLYVRGCPPAARRSRRNPRERSAAGSPLPFSLSLSRFLLCVRNFERMPADFFDPFTAASHAEWLGIFRRRTGCHIHMQIAIEWQRSQIFDRRCNKGSWFRSGTKTSRLSREWTLCVCERERVCVSKLALISNSQAIRSRISTRHKTVNRANQSDRGGKKWRTSNFPFEFLITRGKRAGRIATDDRLVASIELYAHLNAAQ